MGFLLAGQSPWPAPFVFPGSDQFEELFANRRSNESKPETHWNCENNNEETVGWNKAGVDIRVNSSEANPESISMYLDQNNVFKKYIIRTSLWMPLLVGEFWRSIYRHKHLTTIDDYS